VYNIRVKRRDLERLLLADGWKPVKGGIHQNFEKNGYKISVPRHKEINENTARGILKQAKGFGHI
jgi:predicted RNA binding protein YcfA (HicA-like mRNA interferase family)